MTPARSSASPSPRRRRRTRSRSATRSSRSPSKDGEVIHAGKADFAKALDLLKAGQADPLRGRHRPGHLRSIRRHHRAVPPVEDRRRQGDDGRRDVDRRRQRDQSQDREIAHARLRAPSCRLRRSCLRRPERIDARARSRRSAGSSPAFGRWRTWSATGGRSTARRPSLALLDYARAGFDTFDMADHYGSAELIAGRLLGRVAAGRTAGAARPVAFTKWCPPPGPMTAEVVREGVERSRRRLGVETIDLLQFHWWSFEHPAYLDAMKHLDALRREGLIRHLGVTNFDTGHLACSSSTASRSSPTRSDSRSSTAARRAR